MSTTFGYEEFDNGGFDLRFRKRWGDGTIFRGSALTFGGVVYHGDAQFTRYLLTAANTGPNYLFAPRDTTSNNVTLDQDRWVFLNGLIDPAPGQSGYAGLSIEF